MKRVRNKEAPQYFIPEGDNYYHTIVETVMGLYRVLREHGELKSKNCHFWYKGKWAKIFQLFSRHPIHVVEHWAQIPPGTMVLPQLRPMVLPHWVDLRPMGKYIESMIKPRPDTQGITIIKRANNRCYREHEKLVRRLKKLGMPVREAILEALSFEDQINLMRNTRILIGPHGAGMTNMIFLPTGSLIVELYPKGFFGWNMANLAKAFEHHYLDLESENPSEIGRQPTPRVSEFIQTNGWPSRRDFSGWRPDMMELGRVLRDVASFSMDPNEVRYNVVEMLKATLAGNGLLSVRTSCK